MNKMRRLTPPPEPWWETLQPERGDLPAVRVLFAPIGPKAREQAARASRDVMMAAPEAVREELQAVIAADEEGPRTVSVAASDLLRDVGDAASRVLIRAGILDWTGLGGPGDDDAPLAVTPETVEWFLAEDDLFRAADIAYVAPDALRQAEKNASAGSPSGISARATPAKGTARKSAAPTKKAAAGRRRKPTAKKPPRAART
jgi:hypothetical protein